MLTVLPRSSDDCGGHTQREFNRKFSFFQIKYMGHGLLVVENIIFHQLYGRQVSHMDHGNDVPIILLSKRKKCPPLQVYTGPSRTLDFSPKSPQFPFENNVKGLLRANQPFSLD
jgi:hypothetical protein